MKPFWKKPKPLPFPAGYQIRVEDHTMDSGLTYYLLAIVEKRVQRRRIFSPGTLYWVWEPVDSCIVGWDRVNTKTYNNFVHSVRNRIAGEQVIL